MISNRMGHLLKSIAFKWTVDGELWKTFIVPEPSESESLLGLPVRCHSHVTKRVIQVSRKLSESHLVKNFFLGCKLDIVDAFW